MTKQSDGAAPVIRNVGMTGALVSFAEAWSESANLRAQRFRGVIEGAGLPGVTETASTLTSTFVGYDPLVTDFAAVAEALRGLLQREESGGTATAGRLWSVPAVFDGADLETLAGEAGLSPGAVVEAIAATPLRVLMLGFAPGQPYLGMLPEGLALPRRTDLVKVPAGAVATAISQVTAFDNPSPTGWWHLGRMAFRLFRPEADPPIALRPGDTLRFEPVTAEVLSGMTGNGGATWTTL